ncbi:MAG: hypothetical protein HZB26_18585 [Candidatus Hydrogenedentes bacterium]|nr:hypothetical protein [Candidatus Hydrogenedentota bacterium]
MHGHFGLTLTGEGIVYEDLERRISLVWTDHGMTPGRTSLAESSRFIVDHYCRRPDAFPENLPGSFAIALYDAGRQRRLLARDAFGTIPLYYAPAAGRDTRFGTRIAHVLDELSETRLNPAALLDFLTFFWALDGKTFFRGVELLPQGSVWDNGQVRRYFTFKHRPEERPRKEWVSAIRDALTQAVQATLADDLGCHLSGGVDSSAVTMLATQLRGAPPPAFVAEFPDSVPAGEAQYGQLVADSIGAELIRVFAGPERFPEALSAIVRAVEEPKCHPPVFPRFLIESEAKTRGCRVLLTGRGADEIFTGYEWHRAETLTRSQARRTVFTAEDRAALLRPEFLSAADYSPAEAYEAILADCAGGSDLERIMALDARTILANWLVIDYKISGHFQNECRAPFLDTNLVNLGLSIPARQKIEGDRLKALLKDAVADILPAAVLDRPKIGFRTPMGEMMRLGLKDYMRDALAADSSPFWEVFNPDGAALLLERHFVRGENLGWQLWALLSIREWFRAFVDRQRPRETGDRNA